VKATQTGRDYLESPGCHVRMADSYAIVVTTINAPTDAVRQIAREISKLNARFFVVGDQASPSDFELAGATYLDLCAQRTTQLKYAALAPVAHYARKNVGYLAAVAAGASIIIETDDDNLPRPEFWELRHRKIRAKRVSGGEWVNTYAYFADAPIWPRGFPLEYLHRPTPVWDKLASDDAYCPIQQGLADENPDVDAIFRMTQLLPFRFRAKEPLALSGAWCPFNSQNTTWWSEAFPLLYLPYYCSFRMTDIWRSFVAQRIAYLNGWEILFHGATVYQDRNNHNLLQDFEQEVSGYLNNDRIKHALNAIRLPAGRHNIPAAMRAAYQCLIEIGMIGNQELSLLDAWIEDLQSLVGSSAFQRRHR
jgi:STELLO glycosyltransferases